MLLRIRRSVATRRPAHDVFAYVSDFNRAKEWRVEVRQSTLSPPGQVEPTGDSAELTYTLDVDLRGIWVAASPYLRWSGPRTMARSLERLRARRES